MYNIKIKNHLGGGPMVKAWNQEVCSLCGLRFEPVVAHMMATGGLHGR
jgi:hypothetical protein